MKKEIILNSEEIIDNSYKFIDRIEYVIKNYDFKDSILSIEGYFDNNYSINNIYFLSFQKLNEIYLNNFINKRENYDQLIKLTIHYSLGWNVEGPVKYILFKYQEFVRQFLQTIKNHDSDLKKLWYLPVLMRNFIGFLKSYYFNKNDIKGYFEIINKINKDIKIEINKEQKIEFQKQLNEIDNLYKTKKYIDIFEKIRIIYEYISKIFFGIDNKEKFKNWDPLEKYREQLEQKKSKLLELDVFKKTEEMYKNIKDVRNKLKLGLEYNDSENFKKLSNQEQKIFTRIYIDTCKMYINLALSQLEEL